MRSALKGLLAAAVLAGPVWLLVRSPRRVIGLFSGPPPAATVRDDAFTAAFLRVLEGKAARNPEAADALAFYRAHGWIRLHPARHEELAAAIPGVSADRMFGVLSG